MIYSSRSARVGEILSIACVYMSCLSVWIELDREEEGKKIPDVGKTKKQNK